MTSHGALAELWVVIPARDESAQIEGVLSALAGQDDSSFAVLVVDNASRDDTASRARAAIARLGLRGEVIFEPEPGIGVAMATGFNHAIGRGADVLVRTDADARPRPGFVRAARAGFAAGDEMLCGRVVPRRDEMPNVAERFVYPAAVRVAALAGIWLQRSRPGRRYLTRYRLTHGPALGITVALWRSLPAPRAGGLDVVAEDVELLNEARMRTRRIARIEAMTAETSLRRLRAYGARRLLLWHWDRRWVPDDDKDINIR